VAEVPGFGDVFIEFAHVAFAEVPGGDSVLLGAVLHAAFPAGPARVVSNHLIPRRALKPLSFSFMSSNFSNSLSWTS